MTPAPPQPLVRKHLQAGWWTLLVYLTLGIVLEGLHALKVDWYLGPSSETRRLMWSLGHAHGALMGLIHFGFAATCSWAPDPRPRRRRLASRLLLAATVFLPGGFVLGGIVIYGGDPGLPALFIPVGALLLLIGTVLTALGCRRAPA